MSVTNIMEIININDLKKVMNTSETIVMGFTVPETPNELKNIIRKFLKRKSEVFKLITFVYMEVSESDRHVLNILKGSENTFPKIYHIRNGKDILVSVQAANSDTIKESFKAVEKYYIEEMKNFQKEFALRVKTEPKNKSKNTKSIDEKASNDSEQLINFNDNQEQIVLEQEVSEKEEQPEKEDPVLEKKKNLEKLVHVNKTYDEMKINLLHNVTKRKKIEFEINKKKESEKKKDDGTEYRKLRKKR